MPGKGRLPRIGLCFLVSELSRVCFFCNCAHCTRPLLRLRTPCALPTRRGTFNTCSACVPPRRIEEYALAKLFSMLFLLTIVDILQQVQKEQRERTAAQSRRRSHPVSALLPAKVLLYFHLFNANYHYFREIKYRGRLSDEEFASVVMWMHIGLGAALACLTVYMRSFVWMYIVSWWMWWTPLVRDCCVDRTIPHK